MEAKTLQKKKLNKTKLKKTIKNVLCRPDPVFWPLLSNDEKESLDSTLSKFKIHIPEFTKPLWKDLKSIPKQQRPKHPKIERIEGLVFGISECLTLIKSKQSSAIVIESAVNPRMIIQPILEACINNQVPVVCLEGLRKTCLSNFGIPTTCLGVRKDSLKEISDKVNELAKDKIPLVQTKEAKNEDVVLSNSKTASTMDVADSSQCVYLYRTNKKTRVFVPPSEGDIKKSKLKFIGQDFIEFSDKTNKPISKSDKKAYMKMLVKRISNNPNRVKVK
ncbi:uncharacterized protein LOC113231471 [Hyposmocoma kahamanoa]|uniref:uncharacterized protein LOC113231471 n=1 Tax=Hyposmocoma kahamanoa TaxID=1477025 RepID=UPI000E6D5F91|nr:uncharacterized protein LOC113231471 [Hyposmocoma kahamanoa]